jgi:hypothetical protein
MIHRIPKVSFEEVHGRPPRAGDWMYQAVSCVDFVDKKNAVYELRVCLSLNEAAIAATQHDINGEGSVEIYWYDIFYGGGWRWMGRSSAQTVLQSSANKGERDAYCANIWANAPQ